MNAPVTIDTDTRNSAPTPEDLTLTVRDERFNRDTTPRRWWAGDAFGTAWHNALSATFPRGEAFFIEAVKAHRDGADPKLAEEIRAFVKQEINHTREHIAFNRLAEDAGFAARFYRADGDLDHTAMLDRLADIGTERYVAIAHPGERGTMAAFERDAELRERS